MNVSTDLLPEFGTICLIVSMTASILSFFSKTHQKYFIYFQCFTVILSYLFLTIAFVLDDFTVRYVLLNSSISLPFTYKLCAVWGGHEGSMLLWVLILNLWSAALVYTSQHQRLEAIFLRRVIQTLNFLNIGFVLFLLLTSNPFLRQFEVINSTGRDLNPLLQDLGFLFHPPMLYMGYVGFSIAFALAVSALSIGQIKRPWASWVRPWTMAAWCCLTLGITLGSWWAYRELGWGGWWFWDPVENASFMPWLVGTALIHSLFVFERQGHFKAWTILLAIMAFSLSLIGTFLVRSGVLTSVHAFAVDPTRGLYILMFLMLVIGGSFGLFAIKYENIQSSEKPHLNSKLGFLMGNNLLMIVAMLTVLLGTIYPLAIDAIGLGKLSVGAPYFNALFVPLMLPLLGLMGLAIHVNWTKDNLIHTLRTLKFTILLTILLTIGIYTLYLFDQPKLWLQLKVGLGLLFGIWVILSSLKSRPFNSKKLGMIIAHCGVGFVALGISISSGFGVEREMKLYPEQSTEFAGYALKLNGTRSYTKENYSSIQACFELKSIKPRLFSKNNTQLICPEKRIYEVSRIPMTEADIYVRGVSDVYIALGELKSNDAWTLRALYKPCVRLIWIGGLLIFSGGFASILMLMRQNKKAVIVSESFGVGS